MVFFQLSFSDLSHQRTSSSAYGGFAIYMHKDETTWVTTSGKRFNRAFELVFCFLVNTQSAFAFREIEGVAEVFHASYVTYFCLVMIDYQMPILFNKFRYACAYGSADLLLLHSIMLSSA